MRPRCLLFTLMIGMALFCGAQRTARADYDCGDFSSQAQAQQYFEAQGGSPFYNADRLDADGDGIACELGPMSGSSSYFQPKYDAGNDDFSSDYDDPRNYDDPEYGDAAAIPDWLIKGIGFVIGAAFLLSVVVGIPYLVIATLYRTYGRIRGTYDGPIWPLDDEKK